MALTLTLPSDGDINWFSLLLGALEDIEDYINAMETNVHLHAVGQTPLAAEAPNGVRTRFTLPLDGFAQLGIAGSVAVYYEGNRQFSPTDYAETLDGDGMVQYIDLTFAPLTGERIWFDYAYPQP